MLLKARYNGVMQRTEFALMLPFEDGRHHLVLPPIPDSRLDNEVLSQGLAYLGKLWKTNGMGVGEVELTHEVLCVLNQMLEEIGA